MHMHMHAHTQLSSLGCKCRRGKRRKEKIEFANKRTQQFDVCIGSRGDQTDGRQPTVSLSFGSGTKSERARIEEKWEKVATHHHLSSSRTSTLTAVVTCWLSLILRRAAEKDEEDDDGRSSFLFHFFFPLIHQSCAVRRLCSSSSKFCPAIYPKTSFSDAADQSVVVDLTLTAVLMNS